MAERAPNVNVKAALIDMAQTWERLALQNAWLNHMVIADQMAFSFTELREKPLNAYSSGLSSLVSGSPF
jgi:hypothetical protein